MGRVTKGRGDGSQEARLDAIEHNLDGLQKEVDALRVSSQKETRELKAKVEAEQHARASIVGELTKQLESHAVGGADVQLVGLALFAVGCIYSTVPDLVVWLIRR